MTLPKHIIELAIEGGWDSDGKKNPSPTHWHDEWILDPLFWQALFGNDAREIWRHKALEYFDLLLISRPTDKFWEELVKII